MRTITKAGSAVAAIALATSLAACSSSGGSSSPKPVGSFSKLTGQSTTVALDPGFLAALTSLKLTPATVGTATLTGANISFPITGGKATIYKKGDVSPYVQGEVDHNGSGLSLTGGSKKVELTNFVIDPGKNSKLTGDVSLNGASVVKGATLFDLDGSTLQTPTISSAGVATLTGTTVYLSSDAAALLNKTFGVTALAGGRKVKIGVATIKATGTA